MSERFTQHHWCQTAALGRNQSLKYFPVNKMADFFHSIIVVQTNVKEVYSLQLLSVPLSCKKPAAKDSQSLNKFPPQQC